MAEVDGRFAIAALHSLKNHRDETDKALEVLGKLKAGDGIEVATINAAIVGAASNRELSTAIIAATEILDLSIKQLNNQIQNFTTKADEGTDRLAKWTMWLAFSTGALFVAALAQAYVMWVKP